MIYGDILYILLELLMCGVCFYLGAFAEKNINSKFKLVYLVPGVLTLVMVAVTGYDNLMLPAYIGGLIMVVGFFKEIKKVRQLVAIVVALLTVITVPLCNVNKTYRAPNYLREFENTFDTMREHYDMTEYKAIDWDKLYEEYHPQFAEINKNHDEVANFILWQQFCREFHDGHVNYMTSNTKVLEEVKKIVYGNDYGFSMLTLSDGTTVAVNVDKNSKAYEAGIVNGTEIVTWDGQDITEFIENSEFISSPYMPVKENEDFIKPVYAAGQGGDTINVEYKTNDGTISAITLEKIGSYSDRLEDTMTKITEGRNESNLTVTKVSDDTACVRLREMRYDTNADASGNFNEMYEELDAKLEEQRADGVKDIIFDLRNNQGGDPNFIEQIFKMMYPVGEYGYAYSGIWDYENNEFKYDETTGKYEVGACTTFEGEGKWDDAKIIILVSCGTISAGDHFTEVMSRLDNVTIMGFTSSNCSGQAIRGVVNGKDTLTFSTVPTLNEDGTMYVDAGADRLATIPLDVKIELDKKAITQIFDEEEDYLLQLAIDYQ